VLGKALDVGSGMLTPVRDVVEEIVRLTQPSLAPRFWAVPERPNERIRVVYVERTQALLGWAPRTPLSCGLSATVDWYTAREDAA
jgi:UDP-glucose 4-epimerase